MKVKLSSNRRKSLMDVAVSSQGDITPGGVSQEGSGHGASSACHTFMTLVALRETLTDLNQ